MVALGAAKEATVHGGRSPIKLNWFFVIIKKKKKKNFAKKGTRGELRFRFQLTNAEKFEKVAFIDVFDCEAEQNLQSNIEVSNILRGNFKLVVDQKMQLSNKRLCLRVHCAAKQAANASQKPQPIVFETKKFHVEFTGAQGSNALVKSSKSPNATKVDTKTKVKTDATKKVPKDPNRKIGASSQSKKNKASNKTSAKNIQEHNPKEEKKDTSSQLTVYKVNNHSQPLSLPQSSENSGDIKAPETKSDDERNQLANKHLPLADNISAAESVGSQDMDDTNGTQPRLSLIKSKHDENNQPADYTDSSEEEEINSGDEQAVDSPDSPVHHPRTQESVEIDRLMKRKFSTRGPAFNNHSTVLEDPDLVIVVGYSDSDEETSDKSLTTQSHE
ncbi:hypothetical protein RFI_16960 [Reticulomyxa filosa]|uniref:Uncharacterized protein n=1 Tax=Reticulomyxa filosa TaxID=46433 RepID=X6N1V3_RETFI|nr:hypothetical protein RFI_16960 [Reticulomyxa filosa]|eukprot:ETO20255.1 hypothetical protein RFI_16960 [Reticulomyxa filosa]